MCGLLFVPLSAPRAAGPPSLSERLPVRPDYGFRPQKEKILAGARNIGGQDMLIAKFAWWEISNADVFYGDIVFVLKPML